MKTTNYKSKESDAKLEIEHLMYALMCKIGVLVQSSSKESIEQALSFYKDKFVNEEFWIVEFNYQTHIIGNHEVVLRKEPLSVYCANDFYRKLPYREEDFCLNHHLMNEMFPNLISSSYERVPATQIKLKLIYSNIVSIYTVWFQDQPFMIMQYGDGDFCNRIITDQNLYINALKYLFELNISQITLNCLNPIKKSFDLTCFNGNEIINMD